MKNNILWLLIKNYFCSFYLVELNSLNGVKIVEDNELDISLHHGTTSSSADGIYKMGFKHSTKKNEWLGYGVYFFEKYSDAKWWSELEVKKPQNTNEFPEVLTVDVSCPTESFFDLDCEKNMNILEKEMRAVFNSLGKNGCGDPIFEDDAQLRCFCCNLYRKQHTNIKVMAFSFPTGKIVYNFLGFSTPIIRRQYCVNDNSVIALRKREVIDYAI